jgi:hypothetical protein
VEKRRPTRGGFVAIAISLGLTVPAAVAQDRAEIERGTAEIARGTADIAGEAAGHDRNAVYRVSGASAATDIDTESLLWVRWTSGLIELQDPMSSVGYAYRRLRGGRLELFQLFHPYQTVIRYELRDAWLFDENADFANEVQFWDGTLLNVLKRREDEKAGSHDTVDYFGTVDNAEIELQWLATLQIPGRIRITTPAQAISFEQLVEHSGVDPYDWPEWEDSYEDIDFVDLSDREEHPLSRLIHAEQHSLNERH